MAPSGLAILIGAGPATGAGIARILAHPSHGNLAVALLARRQDALNDLAKDLRSQTPDGVFETFATDTSPEKLRSTFADIKSHQSFRDLKLRMAIFSIKNSSKKPFLHETFEDFMAPLEDYVGGAVVFAQESIKRFFEDHGEKTLAEGNEKKGTLIFTGTLGALRCNAEYASYGASRASVRQLAQALAREMSAKGIHVAHAIANGRIIDKDNAETQSGKHIAAEAVGKTYLWLVSYQAAFNVQPNVVANTRVGRATSNALDSRIGSSSSSGEVLVARLEAVSERRSDETKHPQQIRSTSQSRGLHESSKSDWLKETGAGAVSCDCTSILL
jgi:short-subunit dehydrogenase